MGERFHYIIGLEVFTPLVCIRWKLRTMKCTFFRGAAALAGCLLLSASHAATQFVATLDGDQENPPFVTNAEGSATATLVDLGGGDFRLDFSVTVNSEINFTNFDAGLNNGNNNAAGGFHIHNGPRGVNAGVVYGIFGPDHDFDNDVVAVLNGDNSTTFTGTWSPADGATVGNINGFAADFLAAGPGDDVDFYFNVHTPAKGSGEIRGQLVAIPEPATIALLLLGGLAALEVRRNRPGR